MSAAMMHLNDQLEQAQKRITELEAEVKRWKALAKRKGATE
jgi:uncharacterized small protein (DUF1192 family)